jgi:hypothetical protein
MSLQILITFPGSMTLGEFEDRVQRISKMGCAIQLGTDITHPIGELKVSKKTRQVNDEGTVTESLTAAEEALMDQGLKLTHEKGVSPLLDAMTAARVGKLRPNMSREIIAYYQENPGHTTAQGASNLADRFEAHYVDINDAFTKIRNLINTMAYAKGGQKALEKRGGHVGRGGSAQVFALV